MATIDIYADADATLDANNPSNNYGSSANLNVTSGLNGRGYSTDAEAVMSFPTGSIPAGATIAKATLRVWQQTMSGAGTGLGIASCADFTEGAVTWNTRPAEHYLSNNLLSAGQYSLESAPRGWGGMLVNCTMNDNDNGVGVDDGVYALSITSIAAGDMSIGTAPWGTTGAIPVTPGTKITASSRISPVANTPRFVKQRLFWWKSNGTASAHPSDDGALVMEVYGGYAVALAVAIVPADAAYCSIAPYVVGTAAANEKHAIDTNSVAVGVAFVLYSSVGPNDQYNAYDVTLAIEGGVRRSLRFRVVRPMNDGSKGFSGSYSLSSRDKVGTAQDPYMTVIYNTPPGAPGVFTSPVAGAYSGSLIPVAFGAAVDPDSDVGITYDLDYWNGSAWVDVYAPIVFGFTGAEQTYVVPAGVTSMVMEAWGAAGGDAGIDLGGRGGYAAGTIAVTPGETLRIYVGGRGGDGDRDPAAPNNTAAGGYNGGAVGGTPVGQQGAAGGGGASDVRRGGAALANRVLVGAGGGGAGVYQYGPNPQTGGDGGAATGEDGHGAPGAGGFGGTQTAGGLGGATGQTYAGSPGALGVGGAGRSSFGGATMTGGGGGGGLYGGGGGAASVNTSSPDDTGGGGGGSNFVSGTATSSVRGTWRGPDLLNGNGQVRLTPVMPNWDISALSSRSDYKMRVRALDPYNAAGPFTESQVFSIGGTKSRMIV